MVGLSSIRKAGGSKRGFDLSLSRRARRDISKLCITEYVMTHSGIVIHNMEFINYNLKIPQFLVSVVLHEIYCLSPFC